MGSYAENVGLGIAHRKIRETEEENEKLRITLGQWKQHAQKLQASLDEQVIETARMEVLRETLLTELLKAAPNHRLKDRTVRVALADDKKLVAIAVTKIGRPDLADKV
ncbi:MAG: hypothetical protein BroJett012_20690 [Betaproteobacteria bacterium]|nr:MAG: hypothetical protein BroJett012_20690 [Betaproteobacteria bacterium]